MCGIIGFCGKNPEKIIIDNLKKLEYRGYDSAGVAVKVNDAINVFKSKGEISNLEKIVRPTFGSDMGIGHTRWATHGKPDEINAHPHVSSDGNWAIVHNGIIENYAVLKEQLIKKGYSFYSETDTETVAKLLEYYYQGDVLSALQKTCAALHGSYALCVLHKGSNGIYFALNGEQYLINDKKFLVLGGAYSVDKFYRLRNGYPWWEHEQPTSEEREDILKKIKGKSYDYILSHTCPYDYRPVEAFLSGISQSEIDTSQEEFLQKVHDSVKFKYWYLGHWHIEKQVDKIRFMYQEMEEIK